MNDILNNIPSVAQYVVLATGILVMVGGLIGFLKAQSMPSLISGGISGLVTIGAFGLTFVDMKLGLGLAFIVMVLLQVVFAIRIKKTKKFMPAGMMLMIVGATEVILILALIKLFDII